MPPSLNPEDHSQVFLLPWYLNGSLSGIERQALAAHLARCVQCRHELANTREMRGRIRVGFAADPGPSPDIKRRVMDCIDRLQA